MSTFLLIILVLDALVLIAAILLQAGKGTGLAASFGGATSSADALIGTRQAGNLLTQISWWAGGIFLGLAFILQLTQARGGGAPKSVLDKPFSAVPAPPSAPAGGGAAPALPLSPATPGTGNGGGAPAQPAPAAPAPKP